MGQTLSKRKRLVVKLYSNTTSESEAHEEMPAPRKKKGDGGKSLQPTEPKKKKNAKANRPPQPQARQENEAANQDRKE